VTGSEELTGIYARVFAKKICRGAEWSLVQNSSHAWKLRLRSLIYVLYSTNQEADIYVLLVYLRVLAFRARYDMPMQSGGRGCSPATELGKKKYANDRRTTMTTIAVFQVWKK
jgi:hypothetical protein